MCLYKMTEAICYCNKSLALLSQSHVTFEDQKSLIECGIADQLIPLVITSCGRILSYRPAIIDDDEELKSEMNQYLFPRTEKQMYNDDDYIDNIHCYMDKVYYINNLTEYSVFECIKDRFSKNLKNIKQSCNNRNKIDKFKNYQFRNSVDSCEPDNEIQNNKILFSTLPHNHKTQQNGMDNHINKYNAKLKRVLVDDIEKISNTIDYNSCIFKDKTSLKPINKVRTSLFVKNDELWKNDTKRSKSNDKKVVVNHSIKLKPIDHNSKFESKTTNSSDHKDIFKNKLILSDYSLYKKAIVDSFK